MAGTFALIGAGIGSVVPVVGTIVGALIGGAIGLVVGGIMGFFGGGNIAKFMVSMSDFVSGAFNTMVQGVKDFFFDKEIGTPDGVYTQRSVLGEVKDVMAADFKLMGENIKDFFYDEDGNLFGINFSFLTDLLPSIEDIARTIYEALPQWARPDTLNEKLAEVESDLEEEKAKPTREEVGFFNTIDTQDPSRIKRLTKKKNKIEAEIEEQFPGMTKQSSSSAVSTTVDSPSIGNGDGSMIAKMIVVAKETDRIAEKVELAKQKEAMRNLQNINAINNSKNNSDNVVSTAYYGPGLSLEHGPAITALEQLSK